MFLHGAQPRVEPAGTVELRPRGVGRAFAHDLGRDPLGDLADHPAISGQKRIARVALNVDEAG